MILGTISQIFKNPVDLVFFGSIIAGVSLFVILFVASKVVQYRKDKKYEEIFDQKKKEQELEDAQKKTNEDAIIEKKTLNEPQNDADLEVLEEPVEQKKTNEDVVEDTNVLENEDIKEVQEPIEEPVEEEVLEENISENIQTSPKRNINKNRTYNGKYEIYPNGDGYQYRLKASNGEILIVSETYASRDGVIKAIDAVKRNVDSGEIRIIEDKHGKFKFKLTSKNYRVVALGSNYSTEKSAVRASESFKKFAMKADIVDIVIKEDPDTSTTVVINERIDKNGGKYIIEKYNGEYSWDLKATNGQILCQAEGYMSKVGALNSIENFKRNVEHGSFKIIKDKNGLFHYNLYTPTGRVSAIGETYNTRQLAESAVNSVVSFYKNAEIIEKK